MICMSISPLSYNLTDGKQLPFVFLDFIFALEIQNT